MNDQRFVKKKCIIDLSILQFKLGNRTESMKLNIDERDDFNVSCIKNFIPNV